MAGADESFAVENDPIGSTTWKLYVNFLLAQPEGTWVYIATYNTTYGYGVSLAETERKSSGTGMTAGAVPPQPPSAP